VIIIIIGGFCLPVVVKYFSQWFSKKKILSALSVFRVPGSPGGPGSVSCWCVPDVCVGEEWAAGLLARVRVWLLLFLG
jgi:hypothetical protein